MTLFTLILFQYGFALHVLFSGLFGGVPYYTCLPFLTLFSSLPGDTLLQTFYLGVRISSMFENICSTKMNQATFSLEAESIDGRKVSHFLGNEVEDEDRQKNK